MITYPNVKLNLGLNVLRKRPDGYHDLETLFLPCNAFSDILRIDAVAGEATMEIEGGGWDPHTDLCWRAYKLLRDAFGIPPVRIRLTKRSPVGAGLGGGSADAAYALSMMNTMFSLGLSPEVLAGYASELGSDCAFFIYNRPMMGEGRGEILTPFDIDLSSFEIRVEIPEGVSVSTREAYGGILPQIPELPLRDALRLPVEQWKDTVRNDFETTVFRSHPEIAELKQSFYDAGAVYAAMSGSGSSVFGIFRK